MDSEVEAMKILLLKVFPRQNKNKSIPPLPIYAMSRNIINGLINLLYLIEDRSYDDPQK